MERLVTTLLEQFDGLARAVGDAVLVDQHGTTIAERGAVPAPVRAALSATSIASAGGVAPMLEALAIDPSTDTRAVHVRVVANRFILAIACERDRVDLARYLAGRFDSTVRRLFE